jgi:hypothetical protein
MVTDADVVQSVYADIAFTIGEHIKQTLMSGAHAQHVVEVAEMVFCPPHML